MCGIFLVFVGVKLFRLGLPMQKETDNETSKETDNETCS